MKKLLISALFVSVFFIGISGLIESASAKLKSDAKAIELINAARIAIGGDQNLAQVKSMTIKGATTNFYEKAGVQDVKQGSLEINFAFPGQFSKRIKIGTPGAETTDMIVGEEIDVRIHRGGAKFPAGATKEGVFIVREDDGKTVDLIGDGNNNELHGKHKIQVKDGKVFITKEDGTVEELKSDDKHRVIVMKDGDGDVTKMDNDTDVNVWTSDDGKKVHKIREMKIGGGHRSGEMVRLTTALLMTAPNDGSVSYKFLGETNVDGYTSNIIGVETHGSSFKLYLDAGSNLPRMISYTDSYLHRVKFKKAGKDVTEEEIVRITSENEPVMKERQLKFSDFRTVGSLTLPHRWSETSNGKMVRNYDITEYEINPANIADKFGKHRVIHKRKMKPQN